jgi:hypothetical protein
MRTGQEFGWPRVRDLDQARIRRGICSQIYPKRYSYPQGLSLYQHAKCAGPVGRPSVIGSRSVRGGTEKWRTECWRAGIPSVRLVAVQSLGIGDPRPFGFYAAVEFPLRIRRFLVDPRTLPGVDPTFHGYAEDYRKVVNTLPQKARTHLRSFLAGRATRLGCGASQRRPWRSLKHERLSSLSMPGTIGRKVQS